MASFGNSQNPWASSYDTYKDCSQGLCSIYCPQWCYLVFPPPPPISAGAGIDSDSGDGGDRDFSPLIIAGIGILASAFILLSYYTIVAKYCRRRRRQNDTNDNDNDSEGGGNDGGDVGRAGGGLEAGLVRSIKVYRYKRSERVVALADCAVCLSEFEENDSLRVLPKCSHAFHVACIDAWLGSHSSCPLCRSNINDVSSELSKSVFRGSEAVVVVVAEEDGSEIGVRREEEVLEPKSPVRSASFGLGSARLLVADILRQEEDEEENGIIMPFWFGNVGTSSNHDDHDDRDQFCGTDLGLMRSPLATRRSNSSGGFVFTRYGEGKNSVLPN